METNVATLRKRLVELKGAIIGGRKNTLTVVKGRRIDTLDNATRFFHIKPGLESLRSTISDGIKADEKAISRIEIVGAEYHKVGRHLKNIGHALMGKKAAQEAKAVGELARTVQAPYRAERACYLATRNSLDKVVSSLKRLEKATEKQPSILKAMKEYKGTPLPKKEKSTPAATYDEW